MGIKGSGALFVEILHSRTVEDRLIQRFELKKVYSVRLDEDARKKLADNTTVSEDRKSGIISITVADHDPRRAAGLARRTDAVPAEEDRSGSGRRSDGCPGVRRLARSRRRCGRTGGRRLGQRARTDPEDADGSDAQSDERQTDRDDELLRHNGLLQV